MERRHGAPAFQTIFNEVFGVVRNQHQFQSPKKFHPQNRFLRPKTLNCHQQSSPSQYLVFPSQVRDQSFIRVAKWDEIREDIGRNRLCQSWDLFIRLNDAFRKTLLKAAQKNLSTAKAEFSLIRALASDWHTQATAYRDIYLESCLQVFFWGGGGGVRLISTEKLMTVYLMQRIQPINSTIWRCNDVI